MIIMETSTADSQLVPRASKKILIVDDESLILYTLSEVLRDERTEVRTAMTGAEALREIARDRYDICLLDLYLPDSDGLEILDHLRQVSPSTTVIIMTGNEIDDSVKKTIGEKAFLLLVKPFDLFYVRTVVKKLMLKGTISTEAAVPPIRWAVRDKREHSREVITKTAVFFTNHGNEGPAHQEIKAQVVDLSESGIGIRTESAVEPGRVLIFKNAVANIETTYGLVRWSMVDEKKDMYRAGLQFL
jgi:DNA-binding NtrC family response regulator